ncbi:MAG: phosphate acyltransferase PlsX [Clostridia bacterium]|nr:phosphate acyltransferase PlsX [Clostridia bacterium]
MRIVLDATGGDNAPDINLEGAIEALGMFPDVEIILAGEKDAIEAALAQKYAAQLTDGKRERLSVVDAPEVITPEEHPVMALRKKKNSPFCVGMDLVRRKEAEAFVSAGSTGAVMAGSMFKIGRIKGISRPALAAVVPVPGRPLLLIDAGANVDCKPNWLVQFALMGSIYMNKVMGIESPAVGLLNIGAEAAKGNDTVKRTYELMEKPQPFRFTGNVEARDALSGCCDVLVADGFAGNVLLKNTEGVASLLFSLIKKELYGSMKGKIAGLLAKDGFRKIKRSFDSTEVGGAPLLGAEGAVVKAHGNSNAHAIACAIRQARAMVEGDVTERIRAALGELNLETTTEE